MQAVTVKLTLTRPHTVKSWKLFPFTSFLKDHLTWLKTRIFHRLALWLGPTSLNVLSLAWRVLDKLSWNAFPVPTPDDSVISPKKLRFLGEQNFILGHLITPDFTDFFSGFCFVLFSPLRYFFYTAKLTPSCDCFVLMLYDVHIWTDPHMYPHTLLRLPCSLDVSRYVLPHHDGNGWVISFFYTLEQFTPISPN